MRNTTLRANITLQHSSAQEIKNLYVASWLLLLLLLFFAFFFTLS